MMSGASSSIIINDTISHCYRHLSLVIFSIILTFKMSFKAEHDEKLSLLDY